MKTGATKTSQTRQRGSALITAVIFSFIIVALAVTFLKLAKSDIEHRSDRHCMHRV